jgi:hypothetical protein
MASVDEKVDGKDTIVLFNEDENGTADHLSIKWDSAFAIHVIADYN